MTDGQFSPEHGMPTQDRLPIFDHKSARPVEDRAGILVGRPGKGAFVADDKRIVAITTDTSIVERTGRLSKLLPGTRKFTTTIGIQSSGSVYDHNLGKEVTPFEMLSVVTGRRGLRRTSTVFRNKVILMMVNK